MYHSDDDRRPREVEIIPPGQDPHPRNPREVWVGRHRVYVVKPGPLGLIVGLLGLGALVALGFIAFLGLFLLWLPILGVIAVGAILSAFLRGPRRL
jgi:hypothetical protein